MAGGRLAAGWRVQGGAGGVALVLLYLESGRSIKAKIWFGNASAAVYFFVFLMIVSSE
jgi:hypothetical protein